MNRRYGQTMLLCIALAVVLGVAGWLVSKALWRKEVGGSGYSWLVSDVSKPSARPIASNASPPSPVSADQIEHDTAGLGHGMIYGTVEGPTSAPVPGATVVLSVGGVQTTTVSDNKGFYSFAGLAAGQYLLCAVSDDLVGSADPDETRLDDQDRRELRVDIRLRRRHYTTGTVRNERQEPIEGAHVSVVDPPPRWNALAEQLPGVTDVEGRYVIGYLRGGGYTLRASAAGYASSTLEKVQAGASNNDFILARGGTITGMVRFEDTRSPAPSVRVVAVDRASREERATETDATGRYAFLHVPLNTCHQLRAEDEGKGYASTTCPLVTVQDSALTELADVFLSPAGAISGKVFFQGGVEPVPNLDVVLAGLVQRETHTSADGSYSLDLLPPGGFWIECCAEGLSPIAMDDGNRAGIRRIVELKPGERAKGIDFVLERGVSIQGRVVDSSGAPLRDAKIFAVHLKPPLFSGIGHTAEEGIYLIGGLRSGLDYTLTATVKGFCTSRQVVYIPANAPGGSADFTMMEAFSLEGRVIDKARHSVAGAWVLLMPDSSNDNALAGAGQRYVAGQTELVQTDQSGAFVIRSLSPGMYRVRVRLSSISDVGYRSTIEYQVVGNDRISVPLAPVAPVEVTVSVAKPARLEGWVYSSDGHPIRAAAVTATVELQQLGEVGIRTDAAGHFGVDVLDYGTYTVNASAPGYLTVTLPNVGIHGGQSRSLKIVLSATSVVEGTLTIIGDSDSAALSEVIVYPLSDPSAGEIRRVRVSNGSYRIDDLLVDSYRIVGRLTSAQGVSEDAKEITTSPDSPLQVDLEITPSSFSKE